MTQHSYLVTEARSAPVASLVSVVEPELLREHARPEFVLNLSGRAIEDWVPKTYLSPAKYHCRHRNAYLFGQNFVVEDGIFSCESHMFRLQYVQAYDRPAYVAAFPGRRPQLSRESEGWRVSFDDKDVARIDEPVFLATPVEPDNWGRWVSTVIPKALWFLGNSRGRKFFCRAKHAWQLATLAAVGITPELLLEHDPGRTYRCADLETIRYSATNLAASPADVQAYQRLAPRHGREKLFVSRLSRSNARPNYRVLQNEHELLAGVRELGFRVIEPEDMSFADQVAAFAGAGTVAGLGGAGMFNTAFCRPGSMIVTIEASDYFIRAHARLFASLGHRYGVVFGRRDPEDTAPVHARWSVDTDAVLTCLRHAQRAS